MQEAFCYFIGILVALWVTLLVAFPDQLVPDSSGRKKKKFSGRHWGGYVDSPKMEDNDQGEGVEVGVPAKKLQYIVGGSTYAGR